jgi:hypothetical protein
VPRQAVGYLDPEQVARRPRPQCLNPAGVHQGTLPLYLRTLKIICQPHPPTFVPTCKKYESRFLDAMPNIFLAFTKSPIFWGVHSPSSPPSGHCSYPGLPPHREREGGVGLTFGSFQAATSIVQGFLRKVPSYRGTFQPICVYLCRYYRQRYGGTYLHIHVEAYVRRYYLVLFYPMTRLRISSRGKLVFLHLDMKSSRLTGMLGRSGSVHEHRHLLQHFRSYSP